ncbi:hypothetical protein BJ165DRAFT_1423537 [Panaeolus papilionaceus]|nr:hypothetical protein BJ165DRAFT_1423537 [Panaeolus papilionaceus]
MSTLSLPISTTSAEAAPMSRSRSSDSTCVPSPPRYSTLNGALPANLFLNTTNHQSNSAGSQSRPPRYSAVFNNNDDAPRRSSSSRQQHRELEVRQSDGFSSRSRSEQESRNASCNLSSSGLYSFKYHLSSNKNAISSTLKLYSKSCASSSSMHSAGAPIPKVPKFHNNDLVNGSLELNLSSAQSINSIHLILRGRIMTSAYDEGICTFLEYPVVTWTRADGHPHENPAVRKKYEGKLEGDYTWPLNFSFPSEIQLNGSQHAPPTFVDRKSMCSVQYDFVLKISHGILRSEAKLNVNVVYTPKVMPAPASILRELAYGQHMRAPGPDDDPLGWQTMAPVSLRGKLFNERPIKMQCTMSLANPQSYVRGSIIPCHLSFYCKDAEGLDIMTNPANVVVRLTRKLQYYEDGGSAVARGSSSSSSRGDAQRVKPVETVSYVGKAVWHAPSAHDQSSTSSPTTRSLEGEIHLDKDLIPSCDFPLFKASYAVELCPFDLSQPKTSSNQPSLGSWPVTIATIHGEGPEPIAFTKPARPTRKQDKTTKNEYTIDIYAGVVLC